MAEIYNFVEVSDNLSTSGVIPLEYFPRLARESFTTLINLLPDGDNHAVEGEAGVVAELGLDYVYIPVDFANPTSSDFDQFALAMKTVGGQKVWVHCAANYRVSAFVSTYGQLELGWSAEQGQALIRQLWQPNDVWQMFIDGELARGKS